MDQSTSVNKSDDIDTHKSNRTKAFQLYSFDAIPEYLQSNPYIRRGYRYGLTAKGCLIRYKSNENFFIEDMFELFFDLVYSI